MSDRVVWSIIDALINVTAMVEQFGDHHRELNRQNLEGLFDVDELRSFVLRVPHPQDMADIVAATKSAIGMDDM
jgi:hypothetical protein